MSVRFSACCILLLAFSGCATWTQHGVTPSPQHKFRIAILPIQAAVNIEKLTDIQTGPADVPNSKDIIHAHLREETAQLTASLRSHLNNSNYFEVIPVQAADVMPEDQYPDTPKSWSVTDIERLRLQPETQAVLSVKLSGFGKIKKKWLTYLIGIGVVEAIVQGVVVAKVVDSTWLGVAVALEEIAQEILVWGGGSYLFDNAYAPVTLEAQLVSAADAKIIWVNTVFVSVDKKAIKALPEEDRKKKEIQLRLTAEKAVKELSENLERAAKINLQKTNFQTESQPETY